MVGKLTGDGGKAILRSTEHAGALDEVATRQFYTKWFVNQNFLAVKFTTQMFFTSDMKEFV